MGYGNYICPYCMAHLDPGEKCDCQEQSGTVLERRKLVKIMYGGRREVRRHGCTKVHI